MRNLLLATCGMVWAVIVGAGVVRMGRFEHTPGSPSSVTMAQPQNIAPFQSSDRDTLLMFVHPQCSCSEASMEELARVMMVCSGRLSATVIFFRPHGQSEDWVKSGLWQSANRIPGVQTLVDADGKLAKQFDAQTSGQVFLYQTDGALLFSGGITGSRGHAGDNAGEEAVESLAMGLGATHLDAPAKTPVFGCSILSGATTRP